MEYSLQQREQDRDYFLNKIKGALMYRGGAFENKDLHELTAYDLIDSCFKNGILLDCKLFEEQVMKQVRTF